MVDRIWRSQSRSYLRPLPGRLGVKPRGRSRRLERVLTDFGGEHSFARAAGSVLEHYGFAGIAQKVLTVCQTPIARRRRNAESLKNPSLHLDVRAAAVKFRRRINTF